MSEPTTVRGLAAKMRWLHKLEQADHHGDYRRRLAYRVLLDAERLAEGG